MFFPGRFRTPLSIAFAFVATHNHFVVDRGGKVFNRSAPVIKLPAGATEDDHLALIEQPTYKRRWYRPDYEAEERKALEEWLADRLEAEVEKRTAPATARELAAALQDDPRISAVAEVFTGRRDFNLDALFATILGSNAVPNHPFHVYKESGLAKRAQWEHTWDLQRREDAGEDVTPPVPPAYQPVDFLKTDYWQQRGKLDVPKERFIAYLEAVLDPDDPARFGWAGWTPRARIKVLLALDAALEDAGRPVDDRAALLDGAWKLLPDVARDNAESAAQFRAEIQALVGLAGPSQALLAAWKDRFGPIGGTRGRKSKAGR